MKVLVTGATGFLGKHVVEALVGRGHKVVALARSASSAGSLGFGPSVEVLRADLRSLPDGAFAGVDAVIHLAAGMSGNLESRLVASVVTTEFLLAAMAKAGVRRLILASTFSVYDWNRLGGSLNEESPLEADLYHRDGYAIAKTWQERIVRRSVETAKLDLTVLRPGFIWGDSGRDWIEGAGIRMGPLMIINGPLRRLPMTHVVNCADCFVAALENPASIGQTFNVIDGDDVRAWAYSSDFLRHRKASREKARSVIRVPIPYALGMGMAHLAKFVSLSLFGPKGRLPTILDPIRHRSLFGSARFPNDKLRRMLNWRPPLTYAQCLERTYRDPVKSNTST